MWKKICCGILALAGTILLISPAVANKNFVADWTFKGSSLSQFRTLGAADWRAENGEIVGTPKTADGGWLILDKPLQDTQFAATFRCSGGCKAGVMLRAQTTAAGIQGVYVQLPEGQNPAASFALKLDPQGRELSREALRRGNGTVRVLTASANAGRGAPAPAPAAGRGPAAATPGAPGAAAPGGRAGGFGGGLPADSPIARKDYSYKPGEWSPLEVIMDANYLQVWINDGPESGVTTGQADDDVAVYGPVALYVGGSGEVRFKEVELKDLGRRVQPVEQVGSRFRMQHLNDFYYSWSATAADFNHDGILDIASGPFYWLGPDYRVSREIYISKPNSVGDSYTPAAVNFAFDYTGDGWPDYVVSEGRAMVLYVNPKGELRRWDRYPVMPTASGEVAVFGDVDGDGIPDSD